MDLGTGEVRLGVRAGTVLEEAAVRRAVEAAGLALESFRPPDAGAAK